MARAIERKRDAARPMSNRLFLKISGGRLRAYSIVKHVGRRSAREYVNPANAYPLGDGFVIHRARRTSHTASRAGVGEQMGWFQHERPAAGGTRSLRTTKLQASAGVHQLALGHWSRR